ncbi:MAG: peptide deformylase [bacterium]|nr:peptide deformylase [bacterium]MCP4798784.1 peptide deformylase [bacterium]
MHLRYFGDSVLRTKCLDIECFDQSLTEFTESMIKVMREKDGVGLAAPQVGDNRRIVIVLPPGKSKPLIMINPVVTSKSESRVVYEEGCLSFPGMYEDVARPSEISVQYCDLSGQKFELNAEGMLARIILHELDHLDGKLFIDHLHWWTRFSLTTQLRMKLIFNRG